MPKQAYVSISDQAWKCMGNPDFEKLKTGYVGDTPIPGRKYEVVSGVPASAKLVTVIYVYEDESLEDVPHPFGRPSAVVTTRQCVPAVFKCNGAEMMRTIPSPPTEFYEMYYYQALTTPPEFFADIPPVIPLRFKLSGTDSEGRFIYLPAK